MNVHKTFRKRPGRLLNVLCTFSLHPVSTGEWSFSTENLLYFSSSFITCFGTAVINNWTTIFDITIVLTLTGLSSPPLPYGVLKNAFSREGVKPIFFVNDISIYQMLSAFFHFEATLNKLFNNCIKLYWY